MNWVSAQCAAQSALHAGLGCFFDPQFVNTDVSPDPTVFTYGVCGPIADCTLAALGEPCAACEPTSYCQSADGFAKCHLDGSCGSSPDCAAHLNCSNGGVPRGNPSQLCYCDCSAVVVPGGFGPLCADAVPPPAITCPPPSPSPSPAVGGKGVVVQLQVLSHSFTPLKLRSCRSPSRICSGNASGFYPLSDCAGPSGSGAEPLAPQQLTHVVVDDSISVLIFVSPRCPDSDFEVWRPAAGWAPLAGQVMAVPASVCPLDYVLYAGDGGFNDCSNFNCAAMNRSNGWFANPPACVVSEDVQVACTVDICCS